MGVNSLLNDISKIANFSDFIDPSCEGHARTWQWVATVEQNYEFINYRAIYQF